MEITQTRTKLEQRGAIYCASLRTGQKHSHRGTKGRAPSQQLAQAFGHGFQDLGQKPRKDGSIYEQALVFPNFFFAQKPTGNR